MNEGTRWDAKHMIAAGVVGVCLSLFVLVVCTWLYGAATGRFDLHIPPEILNIISGGITAGVGVLTLGVVAHAKEFAEKWIDKRKEKNDE